MVGKFKSTPFGKLSNDQLSIWFIQLEQFNQWISGKLWPITSALHLPKWGMLLFQVTFADETPIRRFFSCWFYPLFEEVLPPIRPKTIVEIVVARTLCRKPSFLVRGPYVFGPLICDWFVNGFSTVSLRFGWAGPCWA